jgi:hypothetical protein
MNADWATQTVAQSDNVLLHPPRQGGLSFKAMARGRFTSPSDSARVCALALGRTDVPGCWPLQSYAIGAPFSWIAYA